MPRAPGGVEALGVLTRRAGVFGFGHNLADGAWVLTAENMQIPADTKAFAINMSNMRHRTPPRRARGGKGRMALELERCAKGRH